MAPSISQTGTAEFHAGDILSVITHHMVSPAGLAGIKRLLSFMTDDEIMTHQLGRVAAECAPSLREQFPDLAALTVPPEALASRDTGLAWIAALPGGTVRQVAPLHPDDHTFIDALTEFRMLVPCEAIISVIIDGSRG